MNGKIAGGAGLGLLLVLGVVGLTGFHGGCGGHRGARDPAEVAAAVNEHVDHALDELDATPDQRTRIHAIADRMLAEEQQLHGERKATHDAFLAEWKSDTPDAAKLHALVDQRIEELRKTAHDAVDAGIEVHGILTPDQRAKVTSRLEKWHR